MGTPAARTLDFAVDTERAFRALFTASECAFWLDSSRLTGGARYSFLGSSDRVLDGGFVQLRAALDAAYETDLPPDLPGELACGYVGYFGYETRQDSGSLWLEASRYVVVDHLAGRTWAVSSDPGWVRRTAHRLAELGPVSYGRIDRDVPRSGADVDVERLLRRGRERYLADVERCLEHLRAGDSYEICLTDVAVLPDGSGAPLEAYCRLRQQSPVPYGAYLRVGDSHVLSASPERFLRVCTDDTGGRIAESRPIKGTARRSADLVEDERLAKELAADSKSQAENLMIVDLLRNDLGRVCEPGTIEVPAFLAVETYDSVHQLVSSIRGRLRDGVHLVDAVSACFPPGSMTGAPKRRSMEILAGLEGRPRGIYSGAIGRLGLRGNADLSVVIRTAVVSAGSTSIGAGGAIVLDSDPQAEYAEMLLKAAVPLRAL